MTQNIYDDDGFFANYAELPRSRHGLVAAPEWAALCAMLPDFAGKNVVDLGCGYGWFCRYARDAHAAEVLGLDVSKKMLARARAMGDVGIIYACLDLEYLALQEGHFDVAYSSLALHYIVRLPELLATIRKGLKPGGMFVFSAEHPILTAPSSQEWTLAKDGRKCWPVNDFQKEGPRVSNWLAEGVVKQHRTLGTYVNLLVEAGFAVKRLVEWGPTQEQITDDAALAEEAERPMFFLMACEVS